MKTLTINSENIVTNVSMGEPSGNPPTGHTFKAVEDNVYVGIGFQVDGDNYIDIRPKEEEVE
jgi:hypothetical protein